MAKHQIAATKLENADVTHISLVSRGANRAPFKIIKQEKPMIDLNLRNVFKSQQDGPKEVSVVGYIMQKADNSDAMQTALAAAGLDVTNTVEFEDGVVMFKQSDEVIVEEEVTPVKLTEGFIALCKGFDPSTAAGNSQSFEEVVKTQGFMPGVEMATQALHTTLSNALRGATTKEEAVAGLDTVLKDYRDYMMTTVKSIPLSAFNAAEAYNAVQTAKEDAAEAVLKADGVCKSCGGKVDADGKHMESGAADKGKESDADADADADVKKAEGNPAPAAEADPNKVADPAVLTPPAVDVTATVEAAVAKSSAAISATMGKAIADLTASITKGMADLGAKVDTVASEAANAKVLAEKATKAVKGSIVGDATDDVVVTPKAVVKDDGDLGCIDTSIHRGVRKSVSFAAVEAKRHFRNRL